MVEMLMDEMVSMCQVVDMVMPSSPTDPDVGGSLQLEKVTVLGS